MAAAVAASASVLCRLLLVQRLLLISGVHAGQQCCRRLCLAAHLRHSRCYDWLLLLLMPEFVLLLHYCWLLHWALDQHWQ